MTLGVSFGFEFLQFFFILSDELPRWAGVLKPVTTLLENSNNNHAFVLSANQGFIP